MPDPKQDGAQGAGEGASGAQADPQEGQDKGQGQADDQGQMSNAEFKKTPTYLAMANKIAALEKAESDRVAAEEQAKRQKEIDDAKAKEDWEKASALDKEESERKIQAAEERAFTAEIRAALANKGVKVTDAFAKVARIEYDAEKHGTVDALVDDLEKREEYAGFFAQANADKGRSPIKTPAGTPVSGGTTPWDDATIAKVRAMETGDDPEKAKEARKLIREYRNVHGEYPYKL